MHTLTLRGLAVLALLCFALPRAEAVTYTFGPNQSAGYLDILFDFSDGHWEDNPGSAHPRYWVADSYSARINQDGWSIYMVVSFGTPGITEILAPDEFGIPLGGDYGLGVIYYNSTLSALPSDPFPTWGGGERDYLTRWTYLYAPPFPVVTYPAPGQTHFAWDVASALAARGVPDGGHSAGMLCGVAVVLALAHRRREMPSPRAVRGV